MEKVKDVFKKDYFRNTGGKEYPSYNFLFMEPKLKLLYWNRKAYFTKSKIGRLFYRCFSMILQRKTGNELSWRVNAGPGLYLGHYGPRYVNGDSIIGRNVNVNQNVTIGQENRGVRKGAPSIGDNVWIGAGSVIVGKITIGNNVLIAPNSFVNFDVPSDSIVIGTRCSIVSKQSAVEGYINNSI